METKKHFLDFDTSSSSPLKRKRGSGDPDLDKGNCDTYDVFISFRGEDTRTNFTSHVHTALSRKQIKAFIDSKDLRTGHEISGSLLKAIETSKLYLVIFSPGYGSSRWCLLELENILRCCRQHGKTVIPVFYKVDPSHVRNQTGNFGDVFASKHEGKEEKEKIHSWRAALKEAADLKGLHFKEHELESKFIDEIVADILRELNLKPQLPLSVSSKVLVGVSPHIENIVSLLRMDSPQVSSVGIWGMGGMGKTTIAESVFGCIHRQFDGYYFFKDVREELTQSTANVFWKKVLSTILEEENSSFGISLRHHFVKDRLAQKKVFIVFDDVDDSISLKLQELAEHHHLFGMGSKILMTSRDRHALVKLKVDEVYELVGLRADEALKLFCLNAFRKERPPVEYLEFSSRVVRYARGNALALTVLGSELFNRDEAYWHSALNKIKKFPKKSIINLLRISYDGLSREERDIFIDIICFFKGENADEVERLLNDCYDCAHSIMVNLVDKSLISIFPIGKIEVHDLVLEMGLMMVDDEEVSDDPGKHKRLYKSADIYRVLTEKRGTETIQGIRLNLSEGKNMNFELDAFSKMVKLRWLKIYGQNGQDAFLRETQRTIDFQRWPMRIFRRKQQVFFPHLRLLSWEECPLKSIPLTMFNAPNLVRLNLRASKVKRLWTGVQDLSSLKSMDLSESRHLIEIPNLSRAKNIERMDLNGCGKLKRVHPSVQHLNKLEELDLSYCPSLSEIPRKLESKVLRIFKITSCSKIREFPEIFSNSLSSIGLTASESKTFPDLVGYQFLNNLYLRDCPNTTKFPEIPSSLISLHVEGSGIEEAPSSRQQSLTRLVNLELWDNQKLRSISSNISAMQYLSSLSIYGCDLLSAIPELPLSLKLLAVGRCASLETLSPISNHSQLYSLTLVGCPELDDESVRNAMTYVFYKVQLGKHVNARIQGLEILEWFPAQNMCVGSTVTLQLPPNFDHNSFFINFAFCVVLEANPCGSGYLDVKMKIHAHSLNGDHDLLAAEHKLHSILINSSSSDVVVMQTSLDIFDYRSIREMLSSTYCFNSMISFQFTMLGHVVKECGVCNHFGEKVCIS